MVIAKAEYPSLLHSEEEVTNMDCPKDIEIGERVKIKSIKKECIDPEDYYYLKKFENKIGRIAESNKCKSGKSTYKIEFSQGTFGYFYYEDFTLINDEKHIK